VYGERPQGQRSDEVSEALIITPNVAIADGPYDIDAYGSVRRMWKTIVLERERGARASPRGTSIRRPAGYRLVWVGVAMVAARTGAIALNRMVDARHDREESKV
jgi:hypothetical protein